jgi:hypothetical protein
MSLEFDTIDMPLEILEASLLPPPPPSIGQRLRRLPRPQPKAPSDEPTPLEAALLAYAEQF